MDIDHEESVALRVSNPNQLELIIQDNIQPSTDGFLHAYVSNGGTALVHFDNFLISQVKGKVRQFNDYGSPCAIAPAIADGLSIAGINGVNGHYKNKYTSKELQTGEFPAGSGGLEMFDFEARFYDPQLGRWFAVDPAMQFSNPYLAMGNNPVVFIDPDGEFITWSFHKNGFSIGVNFTPISLCFGGGLNFGWGDGFSTGVYGEVGYRAGGTGFGAGATVTQSVDHNFRHQTTTTTTSAGAYASFGPFNAGANVGSNYDLTNDQHIGYSWSVSAGIGVGNEQGGIGLFVGYGSGGWNYGLGGYYDPRVSFNDYDVVLTANDDGTYTEHLAQSDFKAGSSLLDDNHATNLVNNPNVIEIMNTDGTYTYVIKTPKRHTVNGGRAREDANAALHTPQSGQAAITSRIRLNHVTLYSPVPYSGNRFNFRNFNTYRDNRGFSKQPRHLNLFGNSWFK